MKKTLMVGLVIALTLFAFGGFAADKPKAKEKAKAPTDQDLVTKVLDQWKAAAVALDFDKALALYSDKFSSSEYGDKAGLKTFLKDSKSQGLFDGIAVDISKARSRSTRRRAQPP